MKKKCLTALLLCFLLVGILPATVEALAADRHAFLGVEIEEPVEGKKPEDVALEVGDDRYFKTPETTWEGKFAKDGTFIAGETYSVTFTVKVKDKKENIFCKRSEGNVNVKVNGKSIGRKEASRDQTSLTATVEYKAKANASITATPTPSPRPTKKPATPTPTPTPTPKPKAQATPTAMPTKTPEGYYYTRAEADQLNWQLHPMSEIINEERYPLEARRKSNGWVLSLFGQTATGREEGFTASEKDRITRVLIDHEDMHEEIGSLVYNCPNVKEIWIGPETDMEGLFKTFLQDNRMPKNYKLTNTNKLMNLAECVFVIPDYMAEYMAEDDVYISVPVQCTIRTYSGDVYEDFEKGLSVTSAFPCKKHSYTAKIMTADRIVSYATCTTTASYYYSCVHCGKVENNDKHTFYADSSYGNHYMVPLITDKAYVGKNAVGDDVYWKSCLHCGKTEWELTAPHAEEYTKDVFLKDEWYKEFWNQKGAYEEVVEIKKKEDKFKIENALKTESGQEIHEYPLTTFVVPSGYNLEVKVSRTEFEDAANWANYERLIDTKVLGNDYTKEITKKQLASLAVKFAERLAGKSMKKAANTTFTDTKDSYVLKAYGAGIIVDVKAGGKFNPSDKATRELAATYFYKALQWVKANTDILYTTYDSNLKSYTDFSEVSSWAENGMAFMEALGLMDSATGTTLAPKDKLTIEAAVEIAENCLTAADIGWYQVPAVGEKFTRGLGHKSDFSYHNGGGSATQLKYSWSERIWVTGTYSGHPVDYTKSVSNEMAVTDPYTGQTLYVRYDNFKAVKDTSRADIEIKVK